VGRTIVERITATTALLLTGVVIVLPILLLMTNALSGANLQTFIQPAIQNAILNSLLISFFSATISTIIGTGLGFLLTKTNIAFANAFKLLSLFPLFLPPYILAVAWSDLLFAFGFSNSLNNLPGVVFILSVVYTPIALFIVSGSLANIHRSLEEAGETISNYWIVFIKIVLPLIRPAVLSSFVLIFVLSISEFTVPSYFSVSVLTTEIFTQFTAFYNYSDAFEQSLLLIVISLLIIYPERAFLSKASFWSLGKKGFQVKIIELESPYLFLLTITTYLTLTEFLPLGYMIFKSIQNGLNDLILAIQLLSSEMMSSVVLSFEGTLLLLFFGYILARLSLSRNGKNIDFILLFVFAIPSTVIGIALIRFFNTPSLNFIYGTSLIILMAYVSRFLFISQRMLSANLRQIPNSYEEAAIMMGIPSIVRLMRIQLPLISHGLFNTSCICFLFCLSEVAASIMVYPPGTGLLTVKVFTRMANASEGLVNAMNVVVLVATLLVIVALFLTKILLIRKSWR
jgi:iron(III) transport system permease protein